MQHPLFQTGWDFNQLYMGSSSLPPSARPVKNSKIVSALLLALTLFSHGYFHEDEEMEKMITGIQAMYIISIITLLLTIMGVYGACKERQWALIVYVVGMSLSSLFMFACEIQGLAVRPQVVKDMKNQYLAMLPLDNTSEPFLDSFTDIQIELQCCGLDQGYLDWGYNISESCVCTEESTNPCVAAPRDSALYEHTFSDQPIMIYREVLSIVLCIVILCRLNRKEDIPPVVYSPEAKAGNYTVLADAAEYT
ncbi:Tetraspanin-8 [Collichthys lucidus]|uniref:Tetraspanin-8 n=1 Tax=Collichthys lucidus TaxID=240159 RepID=A0A4U5VQ84_COLLU|nr:Tetraspanin-8 [Collichthys lucidus]